MITKRYLPTGDTRQIWDDQVADRERSHGRRPSRASRIEVVEAGLNVGYFHVDFSPLADITGLPEHRVCLARTFAEYSRAIEAEVEWLTTEYVLK